MNKKKVTLLLMTGLLAASLTACQGKKGAEDSSGKVQENSKAMGGSTDDMLSGSYESGNSYYKQVLDNSLEFVSTDEGGVETYLNNFKYDGNSGLTSPYSITKFAYLDLNQDSEKEVVLEMDSGMDGAFEVLKEIDGTVYGYYFNYRSINPLYEDGSMMGSSGAADNEIYRLQFSTTGCTEDVIDSTGTTGSTKIQATWYDFTTSSIDTVFGDSSNSVSGPAITMSSDSYKQVLNSYDSFVNTDNDDEETYLDEFAYDSGYDEPIPYNIKKFAYLDLDQDSEKEVVLEMDYGIDGAYEVLKEIDGTVYGYNFNYRSINPLYEDGSMMGSSGAANSEIYRLQFSTTGCTEDVIDSTGTTGSTKTQATWYDFTTENIDKILGSSSQETSQSDSQGTSQNDTLGSILTIDQKTIGNVFPNSDTEYLSEDELAYIPTDILRIARNEIFARHGYQFTSDMKTFFENKEWYSGTIPASDWSDSKLNAYEKKNVELIQKYEALGAKVPFTTSSVAGGTQINGDGFTLTLPSAWNSSNYFAVKTRENDHDVYVFRSKNNYAYGYGGVVFSLLVYDKALPQGTQLGYDSFVELGNNGSHYYYMGGPTDIQTTYDISALESEFMPLYNTFDQIKDSFECK